MSVIFFNVEEFKKSIEKKDLDELLKMRDDLNKNILETENLLNSGLLYTDVPFGLMDSYRQMSILLDEIAIKSYLIYSGVRKKFFEQTATYETTCPRCKQKSTKLKYCPYCKYLKL